MTTTTIDRWDIFELELRGGPADGNPFADVELTADFAQGHRRVPVRGFYDGDGVYRVRFSPDTDGAWSYVTRSNRPALDGRTGGFTCAPPRSAANRGPVLVRDVHHFAYADGTRYACVGTTCYAWAHQPSARQDQTLRTLAGGPFNKIRMCVFPKNYVYNRQEPDRFPFVRRSDGTFDLARPDVVFWRGFERRVGQLRDLNVEADLILFHPYDEGKWGFDRMPADADDAYLRYAIARLGAYRNVWWSLANEFDFMRHKAEPDWERVFRTIVREDPYPRLRGIHNGARWYDHTRAWVTHASVQNHDTGQAARLREQYGKPVVYDECCYEGNIEFVWGNIDGPEMVRRFWKGFSRGGYVGHGETFVHPDDVLWWSHGGTLHGQSPPRIAFLRMIVEAAPGPLTPMPDLVAHWEAGAIGGCGVRGQYYLVYFGRYQPAHRELPLPDDAAFRVEVIDTWEMTVTPLPGTYRGKCRVPLPGKPFIALRITRV